MKIRGAVVIASIFFLLAPRLDASDTPRPSGVPESRKVVVAEVDGERRRTVEGGDLAVLLKCVEDSELVGDTQTFRLNATHYIIFDEGWSYDSRTGFLATHTRFVSKVYRIRRKDRGRFERLLRMEERRGVEAPEPDAHSR